MLSEVRTAKHAMLGEVTSAKHAWVWLEKIGKGQLGRLEEMIAAVLSYWLHPFPMADLTFTNLFHRQPWLLLLWHRLFLYSVLTCVGGPDSRVDQSPLATGPRVRQYWSVHNWLSVDWTHRSVLLPSHRACWLLYHFLHSRHHVLYPV
jgi:hypothetical protein